jgi:hypothetical protein
MSYWQILKPQAGQNLIVNPSFENNTSTGWTAVSTTLDVVPLFTYRGALSLRMSSHSNNFAGAYYTTDVLIGGDCTFSVYGRFGSGVPYRVRITDSSGTIVGSAVNFTGTGSYQRVSVTATLLAAVHRLYVQKNDSASPALIYIDAAQLELGAVATTYIDGDQDGCMWDGRPLYSTSSRISGSTAGGVWLDFEDDLGIIPMEMQGVGMPPIDNVATPYALLPGSLFERSLARSRVFTIVCLIPGSTWQNMHALREALIARVQPNQTTQQAPVYLRYSGASENQIIAAHYDSGLDFNQPSGFAETVALRFVAHDPFWYSEQDSAILYSQNISYTDISYAGLMSEAGDWTSLASALNGDVVQVIEDTDNTLIFVGNFLNAGAVAAADYIARYNPTSGTWSAIGTAGANAPVLAVAVLNDRIIVGGDFTSIGGVAAARIASYNRGTNTWSAFGVGANGQVKAIVASVGYLVVAGAFTSIAGTAANRIAHFNILTSTWSAIGTGLNGTAIVLALTSPASSYSLPQYYVGGSFTTAAGTTVNRVAYYNGSTFVAMGTTGVGNTVNALALTSDGLLYVGGAFTTAGSVTANYIATWNGSGWQALPSGPTGTVSALTVDRSNRIYASATGFTNLLGTVALFQNNTWLATFHSAIDNATPTAMLISRNRVWIVAGPTGTRVNVGDNLGADNLGTAPVGVIVSMSSGLYSFTTGNGFYLNVASPAVSVDGREGLQQVVLDADGVSNATQFILPGAQFATLTLLPGGNFVAKYTNTADQITMVWRPRNWSLDV